ncbi:MAG TPA: hypothetical protein QGH10_27260 [Armatimonadota bacterium]|nr:hypothetical protein [Armatimonadota bacterium]
MSKKLSSTTIVVVVIVLIVALAAIGFFTFAKKGGSAPEGGTPTLEELQNTERETNEGGAAGAAPVPGG